MTKHVVALRAFTHADDSYAEGQVILDLDAGFFVEWGPPVGLVREATEEEVAAALAAAQAPKKRSRQR